MMNEIHHGNRVVLVCYRQQSFLDSDIWRLWGLLFVLLFEECCGFGYFQVARRIVITMPKEARKGASYEGVAVWGGLRLICTLPTDSIDCRQNAYLTPRPDHFGPTGIGLAKLGE
jgi:hypothetical protein